MVDLAKHHSRVYLTTVEFREFFKRATAILVIGAQHRESHEHLVGVETRIAAAQIVDFRILYRFDHCLRNKFDRMIYTGEIFHGIEYESCARSEQRACLSCDNSSVGKFDGRTRHTATLGSFAGNNRRAAIRGVDLGLLEKKGNLVDLTFIVVPCAKRLSAV